MGRSYSKYHLTAKPNKQARNKKWVIWWTDETGKRRYYSTGSGRKKDAEDLIRDWEKKETAPAGGPTLRDFAADFFTTREKCPYLQYETEVKPVTVENHWRNLQRILEKFGSYKIRDITEYEFERWVRTLRKIPKKKGQEPTELLGGSAQNNIIETFNIVMRHAKKARHISHLPTIERSHRKSERRDIFTAEELKKLFPEEEVELHEVWTDHRDDITGYMFGLMYKTHLHSGVRPGEIRALQPFQLYPEENTIYIVHQLDSSTKIAKLKKSTSSDNKLRFVRIPEKTMGQLIRWVEANEIGPRDFIFTFDGKPVSKDYYCNRLYKTLKKVGISREDRWLTPYSFRYTFRSRMHGNMELNQIMEMMGHKSEDVSNIYLRVNPEQFAVFGAYQETIDSLWKY